MTIATVVTRGFGSFGSIAYVARFGYDAGAGTADVPPTQVVTPTVIGDGELRSWRDEVEARHRKRQLEAQLAKLGRQEKKLVEEVKKTERKIEAEKRQSKPVEGLLYKYLDLTTKVDEKKAEIRNLKAELESALWFLNKRVEFEEDDEDDIEMLLLS